MKPLMVIADHDPLIREELRRCLASREWDVLVAADALKCLDLLRDHAPQILVLDPQLPWGGGEGVLDWLADQQPLLPLSIFWTNGHHLAALRQEWLPLITDRLERPTGLLDLLRFTDRLEQEAWKWQADRERSTRTRREPQPAGEAWAFPT
jgi:DNA-binding NtrC family response regulator